MAAHLLDVPTEDSTIGREKEELFVFGYACKVFRDDEKAVYIDKERHLIPWMGDTRLMIDRYDGRGHLYDLSAYDAANVKPYTPSEEEKEIECLCDEERWLELHTDIAEKKMYEEEEWKRYYESLSEGYKAVNFSYDYSSQHDQQQKVPEEPALEEVKPFTVDPDLHVPTDMIVPETEKENVRILKTAKFIANHGSQMEIIIKTKQANNEQFSFLHIDADLYPYYKHVLKMIKSGKYQPKDETQSESDEEDDDNQSHDGYLHPSLTLGKSLVPHVSLAPEVPAQMTIKAPPVSIHETSYGQLIKSITKSASASDFNGYEGHNYPPVSSSQEYPISERTHASSYMSTHDYRHGYSDVPLPPGLEPVTLPSQQSHHASKPVYQMGMDSPYSESESSRDGFPQPSSDSAVSSSEKVEPPPPDIQPIIDRMAMYVARNGEDFEIVVKSKRDPMFDFLEPWHMHYPYYAFKKKIHVTETAKEKKRQEKEKPKTVSFSIKGKPREQESSSGLEKRQVFENDSEDEDKEWLGIPTSFDYNHGIESTEVKPKVSEQSSEEKEKKLADERLRDRLALAAREKLMQNSKQKQMQAERKRKAAMFINMLRSTNKSENSKDEESGRSHSTTPSGSRSQSPAYKDENNKHSSKSRSRNKDSRQRQRSRSRSPSFRRSRSRSPYHKRSRSPSYRRSRSRSPKYSKRMSPSRDCLQYSYSKERSSNSSRRRDEREAQRYVKKRSSSKSPVRIKQEPSFTSMSNVNFPLIKSETATTLSQDRLSYSHLPCLPHTSQQVPPPPPPCPPPGYAVDEDSCTSSDSKSSDSQKASNNYMIQKVRAMLKASRRAVLKEEGFDDP